MKAALCLLVCVTAAAACSGYTANTYSVSAENVVALRQLPSENSINVGEFTSDLDFKKTLSCRGGAPLGVPGDKAFHEYIREALVTELMIAERFAPNAPVTLTGKLNALDFESMGGSWNLDVTFVSSNGKSISIKDSYSYESSIIADSACQQTAQAFMPAVQQMIKRLITHPDFKSLLQQK